MSEGTPEAGVSGQQLARSAKYYKKDFWSTENLKYSEPHFRMRKVARLVRQMASNLQCDLLDVGCGPAALASLLPSNVHYYGIDISIPKPAPNLLEVDIVDAPIGFHDMKFDLVVAQGLFEYIGEHQAEKFAEVATVLKDNGKFVLTYMNFDHRQQEIYWPYSNIQRPSGFRTDLSRYFKVERRFAGAHNWHHTMPSRRLMKLAQANVNAYIPLVSPKLAVDYFYVCSPLR